MKIVRPGTSQHASKLKTTTPAKDEDGYFEGIVVPENPASTHRGARGTSGALSERRKQLKKRK